MRATIFVANLLCFVATTAQAEDYNALVLESIKQMPRGGAYKQDKAAATALTAAIRNKEGALHVEVDRSAPSYCSGATYLVFLKTIESLQNSEKIALSPATVQSLGTRPEGEWLADGHGVWGRWNANGPGTAGLFAELNLGHNFVDDTFVEPKPGDFMKIFWKSDVGKNETGHSVIFTGVKPAGATGNKVLEVCFWSSNVGMGYSEKCVARDKIKNAIYSRLMNPENIQGAGQGEVDAPSPYLASLLKKESSFSEAMEKTNAVRSRASNGALQKQSH